MSYDRIFFRYAFRHGSNQKLKIMIKKKSKKVKKVRINEFTLVNPNAAGIDISSKDHVVAVPEDRDDTPVRTFYSFTCDLHKIAEWLKKCRVDTIAIESTGIYWLQLFLLLQAYGFEVYLVNSKHTKNVTGRKDDESDAQWIQKLHSCGLLNRSFQPEEDIRALRSLVRHRKNLIHSMSTHTNRIHKALEQMNIKLGVVINDILGKTGKAILQSIIAGERNPKELAKHRDRRIKASIETVEKSLEGIWREEHLFELKQSYELYEYYQEKITECENKIQKQLEEYIAKSNYGDISELRESAKKKFKKSELSFDTSVYLKKIMDVDITNIYGISYTSALEIFAEVGIDMKRWPTQNHFTSWLNLAPNNKKSGGRIISSKVPKKKSTAGQTFRVAANSLWNSKNPLGDYFRKIKSRQGHSKAIVASARKLAIIYYNMLSKKEEFNPKAILEYQAKYKQIKIKRLKKQLADLEQAA